MQPHRSNHSINAVIYARVSSKEQEREGFSIPAQLDLLRNHAQERGIQVLREFVDIESASVAGRTNFGQMLAFLRKSGSKCRAVLVEKTDRLYRNLKDYATVDELGVAVHFVKENQIISNDSRASENFVHGIKVLMARNYSQNLGEETLKGMLQKARAGLYPSFAPAGYRNTEGPGGRRIIVPDGDAPTVRLFFEEFATGRHSLKALANHAKVQGWTIRGHNPATSTLHMILRKRIYTGDFDWDGVTYKGSHEPLVSRDTWDRVQKCFDQRMETKQHRTPRDFAYSGFVRCGHCGCQLVGELKKQRYVYYHCTGHRGKCAEPYTREEAMRDQFAASLRELTIPPGVLQWLQETVTESDLNERAARDREVKRLDEQARRIDGKLDAMYDDRLEGRISPEMYDRKAQDLRAQALGLRQRIEEVRISQPAPVAQAIDLMDLTSRTADLFLAQPVHEQQAFLRLVVKSASWQNRQLQTEFETPFQKLCRSNQLSRCKEKEIPSMTDQNEIWLPTPFNNRWLSSSRKLRFRRWRVSSCCSAFAFAA